MTGFARVNGNISLAENNISWTWEIKSVNGKSLDLKLRLPNGYDDLTMILKNKASETLNRGSVSVFLEVVTENNSKNVKIDEKLLDELTCHAISLCQKHPEIPEKWVKIWVLIPVEVCRLRPLSPAPKSRNSPKVVRFYFLERFVRRDSRSRAKCGLLCARSPRGRAYVRAYLVPKKRYQRFFPA
jgi:hypothetical protein